MTADTTGVQTETTSASETNTTTQTSSNFIKTIINEDLKNNKNGGRVQTRFPPEPNGYLHIGHAKSICLNFGLAKEYPGGKCNLRFDDTNPTKEDVEYVDSIQEDVRWLGFDWENRLYFASDYFEKLYGFAVELIKQGKAYVCSLTGDQVREHRGTLTQPGKDSPDRDRSIADNLDLFARMRAGEFADGTYTLRAKIDMSSPNINMRDPAVYRIRRFHHHRTGDAWCIYPMYDFAHCFSDMLEGITHSICTLEFEDHRPLYDWFLDQVKVPCHPQQIEFARLNLSYTMMSKRKLLELVKTQTVAGWDDPRMPTIAGMRRRGYMPESIRAFCEAIGVAKANSMVDMGLLESCVRDELNKHAQRIMAVVKPLKIVIENYPEGKVEEVDGINNPEDPTAGSRKIPFSREVYIDQDDFREVPPKGYYRLSPGKEIRLKFAYYITCQKVIKDEKTGEIIELRCTYDPASRGGTTADMRKVKGTSHWVSAQHAVEAEVRLYDHLFSTPNPAEAEDWKSILNPKSLEVIHNCKVEPGMRNAVAGTRVQFERTGYFCVDSDSKPGKPVFNRTVGLRDTWAKIEKFQKG
ncbi:MAG: glutamine--tRNA ligase/YqeY domain fusion protein [Candidatus Riflebacteria bacterium]|nr:glutamine--tRNA ligase/YqeY domain fusion protein [Candidatus Riflebacteria bacterium]